MRQFRVNAFNTLTEKRCQYDVQKMMRAEDTMGAEAAIKRAEIIETYTKRVEKKGVLGQ
jgi:hypothetical protein